jgi:hypothetical protein
MSRTDHTLDQPWSRERLRIVLGVAAATVVLLLAGSILLVLRSLPAAEPGRPADAVPSAAVEETSAERRDRIAAAPMVSLDPAAATRPDPAIGVAAPILIPGPVHYVGPAGLPVFGQTEAGAIAQLAAIDQTVLEAMSLDRARAVHAGWVASGGPSFAEWDLTVNVTAFLRGARQGAAKDETTVVTASPAGGLLKGSDGTGWVLACVLLDVRASIETDYRMGWAHCHRMQWTDGRWQIAPGAQPAAAPSAWPGSVAFVDAGWLAWTEADR